MKVQQDYSDSHRRIINHAKILTYEYTHAGAESIQVQPAYETMLGKYETFKTLAGTVTHLTIYSDAKRLDRPCAQAIPEPSSTFPHPELQFWDQTVIMVRGIFEVHIPKVFIWC